MKFKAPKGLIDALKPNKNRVALLLMAGLLTGVGLKGYEYYQNWQERKHQEYLKSDEYFLKNSPQIILERIEKMENPKEMQIQMEEPEPEYMNDEGVEITKEEWVKLQEQKKIKNSKPQKGDFER